MYVVEVLNVPVCNIIFKRYFIYPYSALLVDIDVL